MVVPGWVRTRAKKWNVAIDFAMNPCNATIGVYFETLRPALGKAVVTLLSFGLDDVARGALRPKGIYPQKHLGRKKRGRLAHGIPELGEEIGKRLPGADTVKSRSFGNLEKNLWRLDGVSQRFFFWVMIGNIVTDFVYDWSNGIIKQDFCNKAGTSQYLNEGITFGPINPFVPGWQLGSGGVVKYDSNTGGILPNDRACGLRPGTRGFAQWTLRTGLLESLEMDVQLQMPAGAISDRRHVALGPLSSTTFTLQVTGPGGAVSTFPMNEVIGSKGLATCDVFNVM